MSIPKLKVGSWYYVTWYDACTATGENPRDAVAALRRNALVYNRTVQRVWHTHQLEFHVFHGGIDEDDQTNVGYLALPSGMLVTVEPIPAPRHAFKKGD